MCNGVLSIEHIKDYLTPANLMAQRIPKEVFEVLYNIKFDTNSIDGTKLLSTYAIFRKFFY